MRAVCGRPRCSTAIWRRRRDYRRPRSRTSIAPYGSKMGSSTPSRPTGTAPRHSLGAALLEAGRPAEAETVYWEDLKRNPENGWALTGLLQAVKTQGRTHDAAVIADRLERAWQRADVRPKASRIAAGTPVVSAGVSHAAAQGRFSSAARQFWTMVTDPVPARSGTQREKPLPVGHGVHPGDVGRKRRDARRRADFSVAPASTSARHRLFPSPPTNRRWRPSRVHHGTVAPSRRDLPFVPALGNDSHVELEPPGVVRHVRQPPAVGRRLAEIVAKGTAQEGHRLARAGRRQQPDVLGRIGFELIEDDPAAVRRPGSGFLNTTGER